MSHYDDNPVATLGRMVADLVTENRSLKEKLWHAEGIIQDQAQIVNIWKLLLEKRRVVVPVPPDLSVWRAEDDTPNFYQPIKTITYELRVSEGEG